MELEFSFSASDEGKILLTIFLTNHISTVREGFLLFRKKYILTLLEAKKSENLKSHA